MPAGKRLIITSVTGFTNGPYGFDIAVDTVFSGAVAEQRLPFQAQNAAGYAYLQDYGVRMVADAGTTVYFFVSSRLPNSDFAGYNIDVKGYYVDAS